MNIERMTLQTVDNQFENRIARTAASRPEFNADKVKILLRKIKIKIRIEMHYNYNEIDDRYIVLLQEGS